MFVVALIMIYIIKYTGINTIENQLIQHSDRAKEYIITSIFKKNTTIDKISYESIMEIIQNLSFGNGGVKLYNKNWDLIASNNTIEDKLDQIQKAQIHSQISSGKNYTYIVIDNYMYFFSPIIIDNKVNGYFEIDYELSYLDEILSNVILILITGSLLFCILLFFISSFVAKKYPNQ